MYPRAFIDYLVYFHSFRDYFECHEILEEYWKKEEKPNKLWVGLIQIAVAMYHHRGNNFHGAKKQIIKAITIINQEKDSLDKLGINSNKLIKLLLNHQSVIEKNKPYNPMTFPIQDHHLETECKIVAQQNGTVWGSENITVNNELIYKHKLRDRTLIIAEREKQLKRRNQD